MPVLGSVKSTASPASLPDYKLTIVGVKGYVTGGAAANAGYIVLALDSTRNAVLPFSSPYVSPGAAAAQNAGQQAQRTFIHVHWLAQGTSISYTFGGGLNAVIFYYGTQFSDSVPLDPTFQGITAAVGIGGTVTLTFPAGKIRILAFLAVLPTVTNTVTNLEENWAISSGRSITLCFGSGDYLGFDDVVALGPDVDGKPGLSAATTVTLTQTFQGAAIAGGQLIVYYAFGS